MTWLLTKVIRDRPGILSDITSLLRSRGINIRNIIGNINAIMLEIENHMERSINQEFREIPDIDVLGYFNFQITPLTLSREFFMESIKRVLSGFG
ncbi:MAG: ACT domain-containing protein, partial [Vulcanisaeta sp.]